MMSVLDELLTFDSSFIKEIEVELRPKFDDIFSNLRKFKETGDPTWLQKERIRQGGEPFPVQKVNVKQEKISSSSISKPSSLKDVAVNIKKEAEDNMPAPKKLPPRKKKIKTEAVDVPPRSTRSRTKPIRYDDGECRQTSNGKSSDIIIQNNTITTIDITDDNTSDDNENHTKNQAKDTQSQPLAELVLAPPAAQQPMRTTRSKVRQMKKQLTVDEQQPQADSCQEETESAEPETKKIRSTRTKTLTKSKKKTNNKRSVSESTDDEKENIQDATETKEPSPAEHFDATYVAACNSTPAQPAATLNATVVIEKHQSPQEHVDEQQQQKMRTPAKPKSKKKKNQEIFSPYDKTPLKKKIEAFERLQSEFSNIPVKSSKSTKKQQSEDEQSSQSRVSTKPKVMTPFTSKFLPKTCSTAMANKLHPSKLDTSSTCSNNSVLSVKSLSALKASQAEFQEREKRRQEKEKEAMKKREALLQAQIEEKRRRREEKQLKAQQHREMLEKDKQKLLEEHKRKEEKFRQAMAEREEKLQKQKEEAEKKRLLAKKKAEIVKEREEKLKEEERRREEEAREAKVKEEMESTRPLQKSKMMKSQHGLPIYMTTKPPLLPCEDCYDSDESDFGQVERRIADWARGRELENKLITMEVAGEKMKNSLFCRQIHTPDLQEIFVTIDPNKLKRTSSAIWRKPPRYTLFKATSDVQFSEESEGDLDE